MGVTTTSTERQGGTLEGEGNRATGVGPDRRLARVSPLLEREQVTLDLDSTLVEHHGPSGSRQGTRGTYLGKVAWHPLLCFVAETGEWLHGKLRNGHAAPSTGAKRFLGECLRRLPAGVRPYLRPHEGFWGQELLAAPERPASTYTAGAALIAPLQEPISESAPPQPPLTCPARCSPTTCSAGSSCSPCRRASARAMPRGCASASSRSPVRSGAAGGGSFCAFLSATSSSPTSSEHCNGSAASRGRPPNPDCRPAKQC